MAKIVTPQTHPEHHTVGHHFVGGCVRCGATQHVYYCDSYDPSIGYWMVRADCPPEHIADTDGEWRRNVSERAIGRTFHIVRDDYPDMRPMTAWGPVERELLTIPPVVLPLPNLRRDSPFVTAVQCRPK
jgi:hypothetical protein